MAGADEMTVPSAPEAPARRRLTFGEWSCWCAGLAVATLAASWLWHMADDAGYADTSRGFAANLGYVLVTAANWGLSAPASLMVALAGEAGADIPEYRLHVAMLVAEWVQWLLIWAAGALLLRAGVRLRVYHVVAGLFAASLVLLFVAH